LQGKARLRWRVFGALILALLLFEAVISGYSLLGLSLIADWIERRHDLVGAIATAVIAVFTITLWRATNKMWRSSESQLAHLSMIAERQLRAYLIISNVEIIGVEVGQTPGAIVTITNGGQTPAYEVASEMAIGLLDSPTVEPGDGPATSPFSQTTLGPGEKYQIRARIRGVLSSDEVQQISNGSKVIRVVGVVSYRDIFKHRRTTNMNAFYGGEYGINVAGAPAHGSTGNEAD
jgi:hypothetical protein